MSVGSAFLYDEPSSPYLFPEEFSDEIVPPYSSVSKAAAGHVDNDEKRPALTFDCEPLYIFPPSPFSTFNEDHFFDIDHRQQQPTLELAYADSAPARVCPSVIAASIPVPATAVVLKAAPTADATNKVKCPWKNCATLINIRRPSRGSIDWKNWNEHVKNHLNISKRTKRGDPVDDDLCQICSHKLFRRRTPDNAQRAYNHIILRHRT